MPEPVDDQRARRASGPRWSWRRLSIVLHRDIGYLAVALTIAYGISGIAVNHIADWNPNYKISKRFTTIAPIALDSAPAMVDLAVARLALTEPPRSSYQPDPQTLQLFYGEQVYHVDLPSGKVMVESTVPRRVLHELNQLHLNEPKRVWTYVADLYALSLILLAVTGLFVLKGKYGITGRGGWLTAAGALLPLGFWLFYLR
ncbi:MAG: PepSY-associated TM helix domain-containing protein [Gemmatimonadetes bacterium]|nr:PepSY-associated TM helix domain-containing protein [Gemmatimonadota bacterium]MBP9107607.1 PepSY-associated TM helix domain-containing protein [Gemmatimonadaceae bacterium]